MNYVNPKQTAFTAATTVTSATAITATTPTTDIETNTYNYTSGTNISTTMLYLQWKSTVQKTF